MKYIVPMANHPSLSPAHGEVIRYAQTLGDDVLVSITVGLREWNYWLREGNRFGIDTSWGFEKRVDDIGKVCTDSQVEQVKSLGVSEIEFVYPDFGLETLRRSCLPTAQNLTNLYMERWKLPERHYNICLSTFMRWLVSLSLSDRDLFPRCTLVRGPEVPVFFMESVGKLLGFVGQRVYPKLVKDTATGIKCQYTLQFVPDSLRGELVAIHEVFEEIKNKIIPRSENRKIIEEVNSSRSGWRLVDAFTLEDTGLGRLVTIGATLSSGIMIEDGDYVS